MLLLSPAACVLSPEDYAGHSMFAALSCIIKTFKHDSWEVEGHLCGMCLPARLSACPLGSQLLLLAYFSCSSSACHLQSWVKLC